jgi:hyperosmotically inducible protein
MEESALMNTRLVASCLAVFVFIAPCIARAAEGDTDRSHPAAFVKDSVITTKIKTKLAAEKMRSLVHISVDTDANGMVVLSGNTRTQDAADKAVAIARATEGVTSVQNHIKIKAED